MDTMRGPARAYPGGSGDPEETRPLVARYLLQGLLVLTLVTATVAVLLMWTFLTEPVEVARTMRQGSPGDVARLVAAAVYDFVTRLVAWL